MPTLTYERMQNKKDELVQNKLKQVLSEQQCNGRIISIYKFEPHKQSLIRDGLKYGSEDPRD